MPCTMETVKFDSTEINNNLKCIGDKITHELDKIREAVLANDTPDFSATAATNSVLFIDFLLFNHRA